MKSIRIELLDFGRGIALIAMTVFHFAFDLQLLGFREPGFIDQPHWKYFARSIASSFLFLMGFSLYLAHGASIKWKNWRNRMIKISAAAAIITIATYFATPDQYIFFGILHAIAFASLAGLLFLKLPWGMVAISGVSIFLIGMFWETPSLNDPIWYWIGLGATSPRSSDFVPIFPWFSAPLLGIAAAKLAERANFLQILARPTLDQSPARVIKFIGRNSLVYYLLHQPVMLTIHNRLFMGDGVDLHTLIETNFRTD